MSRKRVEKLRRRANRKAKKLKIAKQPIVVSQPRARWDSPGVFTVPKCVGLRELLAGHPDTYPPETYPSEMKYGDLVRAFAKQSAEPQGYSTWDVLLYYPYRYPPEWDGYPPTVEEVRALAQSERLRCEELIPRGWSDCEPNDDEPDDIRARMEALYDLHKAIETPLPAGERRAAGQYW